MRRRATAAVLALVLAAAAVPPATAAEGTDGAGEAGAAAERPGEFDETVLWDSAEGPHESYHVQGLAVTPSDTILAFTEGRHEVCDAGPRDIVLRRSADGGDSWEPSRVVVPSVDGQSWGNPTPVVDRETGEIFLFFGLSILDPANTGCSGDYQELYLSRSTDDGLTWSAPEELDELFAGNPYAWTLHGPGPGHGLQLQDGRLVMQVLHRRQVVGHTTPERMYGVSAIYSDDNGATWQAGEPIPVDVDYPINESRLYERGDGALVVNGRSAAGGHRQRISAVSTDGGQTWSDPVLEPATGRYTAVDAGFLRYEGADGVGRLLHSRPDSARREALTVSVSYDDGATYRYDTIVNPGASYYSDLAVLSDGTILLFYGRDGEILGSPQRLVMARFDLAWLTNGRDTGAGSGVVEHAVELGDTAGAITRPPSRQRPEVVADENARGGAALTYTATGPGDYLERPFRLPRDEGAFEVAVRYARGRDAGRIQVSIDGQVLPDGVLDPSLDSGDAYQTYQHGAVALERGLHRIRFTLLEPGRLGGTEIAPDELTLIAAEHPSDEAKRDVVVDDESVGAFAFTGTWSRATGQAGHPYYGVSYRSAPAGSGDRTASWQVDVPVTGEYHVLAYAVAHANRAPDAPFTVHHADGSTTVRLDQRGQARAVGDTRPGVWADLGAFRFEAGAAGRVELTNAAGGFVVADAVMVTRDPVPGAVTGVTAAASSPSSALVSWAPVDGADGYDVEVRAVGAGLWSLAGRVTSGATSLDVTGLTEPAGYEFRVYAFTEPDPGRPALAGPASAPVSATG